MRKLKKMWQHRTVWFNSLMLLTLPVALTLSEYLPQLQIFLDPETYKMVGLATVVLNILLQVKKGTVHAKLDPVSEEQQTSATTNDTIDK